jgi:hypothetical protein
MRAENTRFVGEKAADVKPSKPVPNQGSLMKKFLVLAVALAVGYLLFNGLPAFTPSEPPPSNEEQRVDRSDAIIAHAFSNHQSNLQIFGQGVVAKILPDDNSGSRHQKFIIRLSSGQTLLVAHNIDLAPRINSLKQGDSVQFYGEYEWNEKGGVLHWTHRDPSGSHEGGWLEHQGQRYQ